MTVRRKTGVRKPLTTGPRGPASRSKTPTDAGPQKTNGRRPLTATFDRVFEKIYRLVLRIPPGRVMTYGQLARFLEERYSPRLVGWAMHATPHDERNIPWHRVINSRGAVSTGKIILHEPELQKLMLEAEGIVFDGRGCCELAVYQWSPRKRARNLLAKSKGKPATKTAGRIQTRSARKKPKGKE